MIKSPLCTFATGEKGQRLIVLDTLKHGVTALREAAHSVVTIQIYDYLPPGGTSVQTPGSVNEGGELGYVLAQAFGAVFDNPDLIAVAVVRDGEAETGPLEG